MLIAGNCHCSNISFELATSVPVEKIRPRACDCSFCRMHGAKTWSDPGGKALIRIKCEDALQRYRFALGITDFLICRKCGVCAGAVVSDQGRIWSTLNLRLTPLSTLEARPASYGSELAKERIARRKLAWTPTQIEFLRAVDENPHKK